LHTSLLAPAFAAIIYGLAQARSLTVLNFRPMVLLGDASYSFYLLHSFLIGVCFFGLGVEFRQWGTMGILLCLAITCGLSILVYLFLEEPARRSLRRQPKAVVAAPGPTSSAGAAVV